MKRRLLFVPAIALLAGCNPGLMHTPEYQNRPPVESSLIKSDQDVLGDDVIQKILSSKLVLPPKAKIAVLRFNASEETTWSRHGYWRARTEGYVKLQQEYGDSISGRLERLPRVVEVATLPSLLVPEQPTVPKLREAAVRLQADLLLIYRISSDQYQDPSVFGKDRAKAYSTVEMLLLDIRTGLIPFTTVVTQDFETIEATGDYNIDETTLRAERTTTATALANATNRLTAFLGSVP